MAQCSNVSSADLELAGTLIFNFILTFVNFIALYDPWYLSAFLQSDSYPTCMYLVIVSAHAKLRKPRLRMEVQGT